MQTQESGRLRLFWLVWSVLTAMVVVFAWNFFSTMG